MAETLFRSGLRGFSGSVIVFWRPALKVAVSEDVPLLGFWKKGQDRLPLSGAVQRPSGAYATVNLDAVLALHPFYVKQIGAVTHRFSAALWQR